MFNSLVKDSPESPPVSPSKHIFDIGYVSGIDLHGHSPKTSKKRERKARKSVGGMKFSPHTQPEMSDDEDEEIERQRYHVKHDVGDISGLDLHGHSPSSKSPDRGRSRTRRKSAKPTFTPHPNRAALAPPSPEPTKERHHVRHDVGRIDGLDLHGHSSSQSPSRSPSTSTVRRRNSAKPTFTSHPNRTAISEARSPSLSPQRVKHNLKPDVGRIDGLDLQGYNFNEEQVRSGEEQGAKRRLTPYFRTKCRCGLVRRF